MYYARTIASGLMAVMLTTSASAQPITGDYLFRGKPGIVNKDGTVTVPPVTVPPVIVPPITPDVPFSMASSSSSVLLPVGDTGSVAFSVKGAKGQVSYSLVGASGDAGVVIDAVTGILTVSPSKSGTFPVTVRATDASSGMTADLEISVTATTPVGPQPDILDMVGNFAPGKVGDQVVFTPIVREKATDGVWSDAGARFSINTDVAPYGLAFDTTTGAISGTLSASAYLQNVVITVTSTLGSSDSTLPFTAIFAPSKDMAFAVSVTDIVKITPFTSTTKNLSVTDALGPVTYSITDKSSGLNVSLDNQTATYTLSAAGGNYTMTVHAVDVLGRTASKDIAVNVGTFYDLDFIAIAKYNACGLSVEGALYCWGTVNPASRNMRVPTLVSGFESGVTTIAVGITNVCAIKNGALFCVGTNAFGQIGDNTTVDKTVFTPVTGMDHGVTDVAVVGEVTGTQGDTFHVCAVKNGQTYCWGSNNAKQIANTSTASFRVPTLVSGIPGVATKVAVGATNGSAFSCAVSDSKLYCWGSNESGQLGVGDTVAKPVPTLVSGLGSTVTDIDTSMTFACAVSANKPYCWGSNSQGQLGDRTSTRRMVPTLVSMPAANRVDVGQYGACAESGSLWSCWGEGVTVPTVVQVPYVLRYVSLGYQNTCALSNDGGYCWGSNGNYVFGDGTNVGSATPKSIPYY
ncbi:hypothetical protein G6L37_07250 [Agrobacterium rubi]|nr:hypothetical protein [Agrobacterium rubi]NTF25163.1 hypothetical protein [Agrobacterium rubi]